MERRCTDVNSEMVAERYTGYGSELHWDWGRPLGSGGPVQTTEAVWRTACNARLVAVFGLDPTFKGESIGVSVKVSSGKVIVRT